MLQDDENPFLDGYKSAILGKSDACPYAEDSAEYARWCRGFGRKVEVKAAPKPAAPVLEGRRPFVEGYKSAILGTACPYEEGSAEYERWWKGYRGWAGNKAMAWAHQPKKPAAVPPQEGRRPFVEGYKSQILASRYRSREACPYEEGTAEHERWWKGFTRVAKAPTGWAAHA